MEKSNVGSLGLGFGLEFWLIFCKRIQSGFWFEVDRFVDKSCGLICEEWGFARGLGLWINEVVIKRKGFGG